MKSANQIVCPSYIITIVTKKKRMASYELFGVKIELTVHAVVPAQNHREIIINNRPTFQP